MVPRARPGEIAVDQTIGVLIAIVSSSLGGSAAAVTRYLAAGADPITMAVLRWAIGFVVVLPVALAMRAKFPPRADWPAVVALGICFFGLFFIFYNIAVGYTTAARAALALSTLPLQTMVVAALLGIEALSLRKSLGVAIAMLGVFGGARLRAVGGAGRRLARRSDHDRRRALHGVLQRVDAPFHRALERARFPHRRHGRGRRRAHHRRSGERPPRGFGAALPLRNGPPAFISASAAARSPSSCG